MTRLLLDENFPHSAARGLADGGHDVLAGSIAAPGIDDISVLALARQELRSLVTFDSDFGDLVFHQGAAPPPAIVYLRLHPIVSAEVVALTLQALQGPLEGNFIVVTRDGMRRRPFPPATGNGPR
jgi:predicted nuclease of predicted toxin-antitoxin system